MTKNNAKTFELDGITYERKDSGYCFRDNARIRAEVFEAAEREFDAPKPARKRRPKDVAAEFETTEGAVTLTAKQLDFLREVAKLGEDDLLGSLVTGCWCDVASRWPWARCSAPCARRASGSAPRRSARRTGGVPAR